MNKWELNPRALVRYCDSESLTSELLHVVPDKLNSDEGMESAAAGPCSTDNVNVSRDGVQ